MRHRKAKYTLNRFTSFRRATLLGLARNLLIHQSIKTTKIKAKAVRPLVEKLIYLAKQNSLTAKRRAFKILGDHKLVSLLFNDIGPRFNNRITGFSRIINLNDRRGDNAQLVILELTEIKKKEKRIPKKEAEKKPIEEKKQKIEITPKEKPPIIKKPSERFWRGIRWIFKKERDAL